MEHHGGAKFALRIAGMVQMRVYYRDVAGRPVLVLTVPPRGRCGSSSSCGQMESEEREGRKTRTTGAGEARTGFERLVGEPEGVGFEERKCGAVCFAMRGKLCFSGREWGGQSGITLTAGRRSDKTRLLSCRHPYPRPPTAPVQRMTSPKSR
jgi:hypothetical protein